MRIKLTPLQQEKKAQGLCINEGCQSPHGRNINTCYNCKSRQFRQKHPERYKSNYQRQNKKKAVIYTDNRSPKLQRLLNKFIIRPLKELIQ